MTSWKFEIADFVVLCCVVLKWERKLKGEVGEEGLNRKGRWASARRRQLV